MSVNQTQEFDAPTITIVSAWSNSTNSSTEIELQLGGPASAGGIAKFEQPLALAVRYVCQSSGSAVIQLHVTLPPYDPCVIQWTKHCGRTLINSISLFIFSLNLFSFLSIYIYIVHRIGFDIGTVQNGEDVVSDGRVTIAYSHDAHVAFVLGNVQQTRFFVVQKDVNNEPQTQTITGVSLYADSAICAPYFAGSFRTPSKS